MSRVMVARRPSGTVTTGKSVGSSIKTFLQTHDKSEHRVFRDIRNLPTRAAKLPNTKQRFFRGAKSFAKPTLIKRCSNNDSPSVTAAEAGRKWAGIGKVRTLEGVLQPEARRGKRDKIPGAPAGGERSEQAEKVGSLPPFGLNIVEDVEPMEFNALKEELTSMEEAPPLTGSQEPEAEPENDPMLMSEYASDIYRYLRSTEYKCVMPARYLTGPTVTPNTRAVLVNWLVQVQVHLELSEETLHMTVLLMDRFVSQQPIGLNLLQLLGVSCLFIASKYEERFAPEVDVLCMLTDHTYSRDDVLLMERRVLYALQFDLFNPTPIVFLEQFLKVDTDEQRVEFHLANYLMDLALTDASTLKYYPSERAAAAACLALHLTGQWMDEDCWTDDLVQRTGYTERQLADCMAGMARLVTGTKSCPYKATTEKFSSPIYDSVSCLQGPCLIKAEFLSDL